MKISRQTDKVVSGKETNKKVQAVFTFLEPLSAFLIVFFCISSVFSSVQAQSEATESLELRVVTLEQQFDSQVLDVLSNYFDSRKFFVDISIDARFADETYRTTENQVIKENQPKREEVIMPGLPFMPESNLQPQNQRKNNETTQTIINEHTVQRLQVLKLAVNVYADSSFSPQEAEFMRLIAGIAAKVNESRGDIVNVSLIDMPDFGLPVSNTSELNDATNEETLLGSINDYIPGFILLLLVGLALLIGRFTNSKSDKDSEAQKERNLKRNDLRREPRSGFGNGLDPFQHMRNNGIDGAKSESSKNKNDLSYITDQFLNNSKDVALLFESWIENDREEGATKAADIISVVDKNLIKALRRDLNNECYQAIDSKLNSTDSVSQEKKNDLISEFVNTLLANSENGETQRHQQLGLFQFLNHLDVHHIVQLINGEDITSTALLIDYLPEDKAARVLDRLEQDRTIDIMLGMTDLYKQPFQKHKEISSRLFSKAIEILEIEKELKEGSQNILPVLERLPLEEQANYINQLKASGSPVAHTISEQFMTVDEIPELDDQMLKHAISEIPTEVLIQAVDSFDDEIGEKLLSVRPKREQRLIRMELQQMNKSETQEGSYAKLQVISAIRNALHKN